MGTLTRKQREIQQREEMLLDVARKMLVEQGYAGLSMDRIAESTEYSKGVIYQHFSSKEDLVTALAVQSLQWRVEYFGRAASFQGRPREKMLAIGVAEELFVRIHPHHFHSERIIKMASLNERASTARLEDLKVEQNHCFGRVRGIVLSAIECGDLVVPPKLTASDIVMALWSLNMGAYSLMYTDREMLIENGVTAPLNGVRVHCHALLDGYGWKPLAAVWDYEQSYRRILSEVFPEECLQAGLDKF
jgi:AcrR family transcriptional regulator